MGKLKESTFWKKIDKLNKGEGEHPDQIERLYIYTGKREGEHKTAIEDLDGALRKYPISSNKYRKFLNDSIPNLERTPFLLRKGNEFKLLNYEEFANSCVSQEKNITSDEDQTDTDLELRKVVPRLASVDKLKKNRRLTKEEFEKLTATGGKLKLNSNNPFKPKFVNGQIIWVASEPVTATHVSEIIKKTSSLGRSLHVNTGTHGDKSGNTVVQNESFAEATFSKEDLEAAWNLDNVSIHIISKYSPALTSAQYPNTDIIHAWCYSANNSIRSSPKIDVDKITQVMQFIIDMFLISKEGVKEADKGNRIPVPQIEGLKYQEVPGDGHCLYHGVGLYCGQDQRLLRNMVALYLESHIKEFNEFLKPLLKSNQTMQQYIKDVKNGKEWADEIEIEALMRALNRPIFIIGPDGKLRNLLVVNRFMNGSPIFLYYNGVNHYDAYLLTKNTNVMQVINLLKGNKASSIGNFKPIEFKKTPLQDFSSQKKEPEPKIDMSLQNTLIAACKVADFEKVKELYAKGASLIATDENGMLPLTAAFWGCDVNIIKYIEKNLGNDISRIWLKVSEADIYKNKSHFTMAPCANDEFNVMANWVGEANKGFYRFHIPEHIQGAANYWHSFNKKRNSDISCEEQRRVIHRVVTSAKQTCDNLKDQVNKYAEEQIKKYSQIPDPKNKPPNPSFQ